MAARLLRRASRRSWARHPLQLALSILGVALGVAVVVSVDLANASARRAFTIATDAVGGRTTHQIHGGSAGVPEELYRWLRVEAGIRASAPVVEGWVDPGVQVPTGSLRLLGVDPLAEGAVRGYLSSDARGGGLALAPLLTRPGAVVATPETIADAGLHAGTSFEVLANGLRHRLELIAALEGASGLPRAGLRGVLVADVATAQEVLGMRGRLTRIDLILDGGAPAVAERIRAALPGGTRLQESAARAESTLQMTRAFGLNLRAMSLLALVCGVFLIYNTMTFSVVSRRELIGLLRALGVTRSEVLVLVLREAAWIGAAGTLIGLAAGVLLAHGLVGLVTRTINDLYFAVQVRELALAPGSLAVAALMGIGASLLASLGPAREATRAAPRATLQRSVLEDAARARAPWLAAAGIGLLGAGALVEWMPGGGLLGAFAGLFIVLLGAVLLTPGATLALASGLRLGLRRAGGVLGSLAARGVAASLSRTAVAVAALTVAVSVIIGVGVMVASFRASLVQWLGYTLPADFYVSPVGARGPGDRLLLPDGALAALRGDPRVADVSTILRAQLATANGPTELMVLEPAADAGRSYHLVAGDPSTAWGRFLQGDVLVSEPYSFRTGARPGARLVLPSPAGPLEVTVAGVFRSYASDRGAVLLHRSVYERVWRDEAVSGVSVTARPGTDVEALRRDLAALPAGNQRVAVISSGELRRRSLAVFDRTFLITGVLRALVSLVAFVGVFSALMAIALERRRELGILRATGLTPAQLFGLTTAQTGLIGLISGILAVPLGVTLGWVMIHVVNRRSFGWSLDMQVPGRVLAEALLIALVGALLAGVIPALRGAAALPAAALREE